MTSWMEQNFPAEGDPLHPSPGESRDLGAQALPADQLPDRTGDQRLADRADKQHDRTALHLGEIDQEEYERRQAARKDRIYGAAGSSWPAPARPDEVPTPARPEPDPEWEDVPAPADDEPEPVADEPDDEPAPRKPRTLGEALRDAFGPLLNGSVPILVAEVGPDEDDEPVPSTKRFKLDLAVTDPDTGDVLVELALTGTSGMVNDTGSAALSAFHYGLSE